MKMVERVPNMLPLLVDKMVQLTDGLPDKPEILGRIRAMQAAQFGPAVGGPAPTEGVTGVPNTPGETPMTVAPPPAGGPPPAPAVA